MHVAFLGRVTEGPLPQNKGTMTSAVPFIPTCNYNFFFSCTMDQCIPRSFCPLNWQMFTYLSLGIQMKDRECRRLEPK